jgi:hypothetical protein
MIDLKVTEPYIRAKRAKNLLNEGIVWLDTFRSGQVRKEILDWIRLDQLKARGVDANEEVIGFYSFLTSRINPQKRFNTHYTLEDTGDFYRSMFIQVLIDSLIIDANTEKMEDQEWWRDSILYLTEDNLQRLADVYKEALQAEARRILVDGR